MMLHVLPINLGLVAGLSVLLWVVSLVRRDVSLVDAFWGPAFVVLAASTALQVEWRDGLDWLLLGMVSLWGLRLGAWLAWRNHGQPEDPRYAAMRARTGPRFALTSLFTVFLLQAALAWLVSLPIQLSLVSPSWPGRMGLVVLGVLMWAVGLIFEAVGDLQLARFRADPTNAGQVMDRGLWRYTRHPNYFGDFCVWWGLYLVACASALGPLGLPGPLVMSVLLLRVSGVTLLERSLKKSRPGYADYMRRTPAFFPGPPAPRGPDATG